MFKKKRNALLEEMREMIAADRSAVLEGLQEAGVIAYMATGRSWGLWGPGPLEYSFTTDLVTREQAKKDATFAAQRAVRECKSELRRKAYADHLQEREERELRRKIEASARKAADELVGEMEKAKRAVADPVRAAGHGVESAVSTGGVQVFVDRLQGLLDRVESLPDVGCHVVKVDAGDDGLAHVVDLSLDIGKHFGCFAHSVSPLRSGLCAGTQSSPASTVAESGCTCAGVASGAGGSSAAPAPSTSEGGAL